MFTLGTFHQYVSENEILGDENEPLYNHNKDIEACHQYVSENGILGDENEPLYNYKSGSEAFHQYAFEYVHPSCFDKLLYSHSADI